MEECLLPGGVDETEIDSANAARQYICMRACARMGPPIYRTESWEPCQCLLGVCLGSGHAVHGNHICGPPRLVCRDFSLRLSAGRRGAAECADDECGAGPSERAAGGTCQVRITGCGEAMLRQRRCMGIGPAGAAATVDSGL